MPALPGGLICERIDVLGGLYPAYKGADFLSKDLILILDLL